MVGLYLKYDRKACVYCLAGQNGHFQSQIRVVVSQLPSLFFVQPRDPSMLCDRFMGAFRIHSSVLVLLPAKTVSLYQLLKRKSKNSCDWLTSVFPRSPPDACISFAL